MDTVSLNNVWWDTEYFKVKNNKLYTWHEAMQCASFSKKRLPTITEFNNLITSSYNWDKNRNKIHFINEELSFDIKDIDVKNENEFDIAFWTSNIDDSNNYAWCMAIKYSELLHIPICITIPVNCDTKLLFRCVEDMIICNFKLGDYKLDFAPFF